ncbi:MAG: hypothetical protein EOP38_01710 [Rubrivivax sp.]|nr:MAG: hypothetical protein EOP38_01710 [Rubrivivax sp.]
MNNPWTKKNPLLSMWLSGANAIADSARQQVRAQGQRQANALASETGKLIASFWTTGLVAPPAPKRKKKARAR